jgi:hypothetical protein
MAATNRPDFKDFQSFPKSRSLRISNPQSRRQLQAIASRMLAKTGFYDRTIYTEGFGIDADMIGFNSSLKPIWHGRA